MQHRCSISQFKQMRIALQLFEISAYSNLLHAISSRYPPTTTSILLDNLGCAALNTHLRVCSHGGIGVHNCDHSQDVILSCLVEGSVRLLTTSSSSSTTLSPFGRLEVYINGRWGTVCDNGFSNTSANVVCQQMGFSAAVRWTNIGAQR